MLKLKKKVCIINFESKNMNKVKHKILSQGDNLFKIAGKNKK